MAGIDRSRISLGRRTQQQTDTRDDNGGIGRQGFMNFASCGLKFFKLGDVGNYHDLNILPWRIGTKNHPEVVAGNAKVGDYDYVLDLMVHTRIGPGNGDYICPKKNFGKPCPICDRADELWKNEDTKNDARALFAKRRCVYLVQELDAKGKSFIPKSETPLIFETSHATFSKELQSRATSCMRGKGVVNFADPDDGKVVSFSVNEGKMDNGKKFKQAGNFEFNERTEEVSDEILEACPSLDEMMIIKTPEQLKAALYGDPEDLEDDFDEEPNEPEEHSSARFRDNEPARFEDDEPKERQSRRAAVDEETEDTPPVRRQRSARNEEETDTPADTPRRRAAEPTEDSPAPRRRSAEAEENSYQAARRNARKSVEEEDVPANDAPAMPFDESTEEETPKASRGASEGECPNGYEYGVDCDTKPLCAKCNDNIWSKCSECKRRLKQGR